MCLKLRTRFFLLRSLADECLARGNQLRRLIFSLTEGTEETLDLARLVLSFSTRATHLRVEAQSEITVQVEPIET